MSPFIPVSGNPTPLATLAVENVPLLVQVEDENFFKCYVEFFIVSIRNPLTRRAYGQIVRQFLDWCAQMGIQRIRQIERLHVSAYVEQLTLAKSTVLKHMAGLNSFFSWLVENKHLAVNPVETVQRPRVHYDTGKTPVLETEETRRLLASIDTEHILGLRDRAFIGTMLYTFARVGAVTKLRVGDFYPQGTGYYVRLQEKRGKELTLPAHHKLAEYLDAYINEAGIGEEKGTPLFRTVRGRSRRLSERGLNPSNAWNMVQRRAAQAGIRTAVCNHSFRATGITHFLEHQGSLDRAQYIAGHSDVRTTKLYDRRREKVNWDEIERIRF